MIVNGRCRTCPRKRISFGVHVFSFFDDECVEENTSVLGETDQGFGEANLPEHLVARNGPFARRVEEYMCLLLSILVVVVYGAARCKQRIIDGEVEEGGRQSAHLPLLVESKLRREQLGMMDDVKLQLGFPSGR